MWKEIKKQEKCSGAKWDKGLTKSKQVFRKQLPENINSQCIIHCNTVTSPLASLKTEIKYKFEKIKYNGGRDWLLCSHKCCKEAISPGSQPEGF